ncbi:hypothetical protein B0H13DRAFT_1855504 [Mycena leptocephala]|nr:hypothetical protein B0H13DRAFT_1855504 [Mycena leptocephala]
MQLTKNMMDLLQNSGTLNKGYHKRKRGTKHKSGFSWRSPSHDAQPKIGNRRAVSCQQSEERVVKLPERHEREMYLDDHPHGTFEDLRSLRPSQQIRYEPGEDPQWQTESLRGPRLELSPEECCNSGNLRREGKLAIPNDGKIYCARGRNEDCERAGSRGIRQEGMNWRRSTSVWVQIAVQMGQVDDYYLCGAFFSRLHKRGIPKQGYILGLFAATSSIFHGCIIAFDKTPQMGRRERTAAFAPGPPPRPSVPNSAPPAWAAQFAKVARFDDVESISTANMRRYPDYMGSGIRPGDENVHILMSHHKMPNTEPVLYIFFGGFKLDK